MLLQDSKLGTKDDWSIHTTSGITLGTMVDSSKHATSGFKIRVITKLPNSEQSYKVKVKTHKYINRQNQSTTGKLCTGTKDDWIIHVTSGLTLGTKVDSSKHATSGFKIRD